MRVTFYHKSKALRTVNIEEAPPIGDEIEIDGQYYHIEKKRWFVEPTGVDYYETLACDIILQ